MNRRDFIIKLSSVIFPTVVIANDPKVKCSLFQKIWKRLCDLYNSRFNKSVDLAGYDPIIVSMIRRATPNLIAFDICGVQPMPAPTGLIFALKTKMGEETSL